MNYFIISLIDYSVPFEIEMFFQEIHWKRDIFHLRTKYILTCVLVIERPCSGLQIMCQKDSGLAFRDN